jgi:hypothetical protein
MWHSSVPGPWWDHLLNERGRYQIVRMGNMYMRPKRYNAIQFGTYNTYMHRHVNREYWTRKIYIGYVCWHDRLNVSLSSEVF